jgi:hypothetical protein
MESTRRVGVDLEDLSVELLRMKKAHRRSPVRSNGSLSLQLELQLHGKLQLASRS